MKEISLFDKIGRLQLRAIGQEAIDDRHLSMPYSPLHRQLYKVLILPEKRTNFTEADVREMHLCDLGKLVDFYDPELSACPIHAMSKQIDLLQTFAEDLSLEGARFDYKITSLDAGPVLLVVFGSHKAMKSIVTPDLLEENQTCTFLDEGVF